MTNQFRKQFWYIGILVIFDRNLLFYNNTTCRKINSINFDIESSYTYIFCKYLQRFSNVYLNLTYRVNILLYTYWQWKIIYSSELLFDFDIKYSDAITIIICSEKLSIGRLYNYCTVRFIYKYFSKLILKKHQCFILIFLLNHMNFIFTSRYFFYYVFFIFLISNYNL